MDVQINKEAVNLIAKELLDQAEKGNFDPFQGVSSIVEDAVAQTTAMATELIEKYQELNNVEMAKLVKVHEPEEKKTDTLFIDICRRELAVKAGNQKLVEEMTEKTTPNYGTGANAGYLAPSEDAYELIDLVFKDSVMGAFGKKVPMKSNTLVFPSLTAGTTAYSFIEGTTTGAVSAVDVAMTTSTVTLTAYQYGIWTTVSNQLLQDSDPKIEAIIRSDITRQLGAAYDWSIFHGDATAGVIRTHALMSGLEGNNIITTNVESAGGTVDFDDIMTLKACQDYTNAPLFMFAHPKAERQLATVKDNSGRYIYDPTVRSAGVPTIWNMPLNLTNQISTTLGGGSETAIFCGAFNDSMLVGVKPDVSLIADPYTLADSNQVRFIMMMRFAMTVSSETHFSMLNGISV